MKRFLLLSSLLCLGVLTAAAQPLHVQGYVVDQQHRAIELFEVMLLRADSTLVTGNPFTNGRFKIDLLASDSASLIKIRAMGYNPAYFQLPQHPKTSTVDLDTVRLADELVELNQAVVRGERPVVRLSSGGALVVDVSKTYLAKAGTFLDVARRIPGIIVSEKGAISVMGKPRLQINLNGRAIHSMDEVLALQSFQIKSISIEREPSSAYSASCDAVLNITTVDAIQDYLYLVAKNDARLSRVFSNSSGATLNGKVKSLGYFTDLRFSTDGLRQYDTEDKHIWTDAQELRTHRTATLTSSGKNFQLAQYAEYQFRPQTLLGLGYRFSFSSELLDRGQDFTLIASGSPAIATSISSRQQGTSHNPSLYFTHRGGRTFLGFYADYYRGSSKNTQSVVENGILQPGQQFYDRYDVLGVKVDFSHTLPFLTYSLGGKSSYINDVGIYLYGTSQDATQESFSNAAYLSLGKSIAPLSISVGLRFEQEHARTGNGSRTTLDTTYKNLFPHLSVGLRLAKVNLNLSYSRRIYRPTYSQLIAKTVYIDPLSYMVGNPLLKSTLADILSLMVRRGGFVGTLSYEFQRNRRVQLSLLEETGGAQRIRFTYANIPYAHTLQAYMAYSYTIWQVRGNASLVLHSTHMEYRQKTYATFKDIGVHVKATVDSPLWKNSTLMLAAVYRSAMRENFAYHRPSFNLSAYLSQDLLRNLLKISLSVSDIFKTSRFNNWVENMEYSQIRMATNADSRLVSLSVQYVFGRYKAESQAKSAILEEKGRI